MHSPRENPLPVFLYKAFVFGFGTFSLLYLVAPKTAHRVVGYLEEEAVVSYTQYLAEIDGGRQENIPAPRIAIDYWKLPDDARLREVVLATRDDEAKHRDVNHRFADVLAGERPGAKPAEGGPAEKDGPAET